jgi:superfamily II DNA or RNA helicase
MITLHRPTFTEACKYQPIKLLPHQKKLVDHLKEDVTFPIYICWSMGSGKTIGAGMCMTSLEDKNKVLIICDKSTLTQWKNEISKILERNAASFPKLTVHIIHYEYLDQTDAPNPGHYNMTIVDESHRFRNAWSKNSNRMLHWMSQIHKCKKTIFLSGTPIIHDAIAEREALNNMMMNTDLKGRIFFYDPRNDLKSEKKYPKVKEVEVKCPMSWAQCFVYLQNRKQSFHLKLDGENTERVRMSSSKNTYNTLLRSLANNPFPDNPALSPKFQTILENLNKALNENKKQIVYSCRKDTGVKSLQLLWEGVGLNMSFQVTGDMSQEDRAEHIQKFNKKPKSVLFITDAGAQGIDLKRVDVVHIMEPAENIQDEKQIMNRAVRYKSHSQTDSIVTILRYISTFPTSGSVAPPWKNVLYKSGMFGKDEMKGITRSVQYALHNIIKTEENGETIDQKILRTREEREDQIQATLEILKSYQP